MNVDDTVGSGSGGRPLPRCVYVWGVLFESLRPPRRVVPRTNPSTRLLLPFPLTPGVGGTKVRKDPHTWDPKVGSTGSTGTKTEDSLRRSVRVGCPVYWDPGCLSVPSFCQSRLLGLRTRAWSASRGFYLAEPSLSRDGWSATASGGRCHAPLLDDDGDRGLNSGTGGRVDNIPPPNVPTHPQRSHGEVRGRRRTGRARTRTGTRPRPNPKRPDSNRQGTQNCLFYVST